MAITKCRIWALKVRRVTVAAEALGQCGRTSDGMGPFAEIRMEKL